MMGMWMMGDGLHVWWRFLFYRMKNSSVSWCLMSLWLRWWAKTGGPKVVLHTFHGKRCANVDFLSKEDNNENYGKSPKTGFVFFASRWQLDLFQVFWWWILNFNVFFVSFQRTCIIVSLVIIHITKWRSVKYIITETTPTRHWFLIWGTTISRVDHI